MHGLPDINPKQMEALLAIASKKLGKPVDELKKGLESENIQKMASGLSEEQQKKIQNIIKDPKKVSEFLSNPAVKLMISKYIK
ncbi:MAG: hypothetical protein J6K88_02345 [Oscillospiraceae bacterium]|nr:hypothetical protein [Oscillospiraceae bacterium]